MIINNTTKIIMGNNDTIIYAALIKEVKVYLHSNEFYLAHVTRQLNRDTTLINHYINPPCS